MKIIISDQFDGEGPNRNDRVIAENVNPYYGPKIVDLLNEKFGSDQSLDWFRIVKDDYKLKIFQP